MSPITDGAAVVTGAMSHSTYINGYMNGPTVSVNIIRNIINISSMMIGISQYFFRFFRNSNSSFNVPSLPIIVHLLHIYTLFSFSYIFYNRLTNSICNYLVPIFTQMAPIYKHCFVMTVKNFRNIDE